MSHDASVELPFADGIKTFRLAWGDLVKLQGARNAGPYIIYQRLMMGNWEMEDISDTIRLGLIGGGETPEKARAFVKDYVEPRPPLESLALAQGILGIALNGVPGEAPGEFEGEAAMPDQTSPTENGG